MPTTTTGIAIDPNDLARINTAAEKAGMSRSAYILQWIPDVQQTAPKTTNGGDSSSARKRRLAESRLRKSRAA